jgi:hypothetical protein
VTPETPPAEGISPPGSTADEPIAEVEAAQRSLPLNPILVPIDKLNSDRQSAPPAGAKRPDGGGQAEPAELQGLRPRKIPDAAGGENAGQAPRLAHPRSPSAPHQIEKELKMAFPERDEGAGTGIDEDLGIDD